MTAAASKPDLFLDHCDAAQTVNLHLLLALPADSSTLLFPELSFGFLPLKYFSFLVQEKQLALSLPS